MNKQPLPGLELLVKTAAARHGHTCPSLVYGCRLAAIFLSRLPPDALPERVTLRHTSSCLRDGVLASLQSRLAEAAAVSMREPGSCSLEAVWGKTKFRAAIRAEVRRAVDGMRANRGLEEYRAAGTAYLLGLDDDAVAEVSLEALP